MAKAAFIPRGRVCVEMGDADGDGRVDVKGTLEIGVLKVSTGAINIGVDAGLELLAKLFGLVKSAKR